ncbi:hypothetical protein AB0H83_50055 [Dactylosporangium sp. NPDC050688]|uniref:hypothetical protein n=1 Tax=Dactylosporangium sp. NPDC050688 TaxID=3157217 RepID=UPI00340938D9
MLTTYFPGPGHEEDHSTEFIRRYKRFGEKTIEFRGIEAELEDAVNRNPTMAAIEVNFALGLDLSKDEVRKHLMNLYDQIHEVGDYDREAVKKQRPEGAELLRSYFLVPVRLPAALTRRKGFPSEIPIGAVFIVGVLLLVMNPVLYRLLPAVLHPITNLITVIGLLTTGLSAWAMFQLRREALRPEATAKDKENDEPRARSRWAAWTRFRA